jgi:uncharacterized protein YcaQ
MPEHQPPTANGCWISSSSTTCSRCSNPARTRKWGYCALPILYGDQFVGKLDATANHDAGILEVHALHEDEPFTKRMRSAVDKEIADLADWLDLERGAS